VAQPLIGGIVVHQDAQQRLLCLDVRGRRVNLRISVDGTQVESGDDGHLPTLTRRLPADCDRDVAPPIQLWSSMYVRPARGRPQSTSRGAPTKKGGPNTRTARSHRQWETNLVLVAQTVLLAGAAFEHVGRRFRREGRIVLELRGDDVFTARLALGFVL